MRLSVPVLFLSSFICCATAINKDGQQAPPAIRGAKDNDNNKSSQQQRSHGVAEPVRSSAHTYPIVYEPFQHGDYSTLSEMGCPNKWGWSEDVKDCRFYPCKHGFDQGVWGETYTTLEVHGPSGVTRQIPMYQTCEYAMSHHLSKYFSDGSSHDDVSKLKPLQNEQFTCHGKTCLMYSLNFLMFMRISSKGYTVTWNDDYFFAWLDSFRASVLHAVELHPGAELVVMDDLVLKSPDIDNMFNDLSVHHNINIRRLVFEGYIEGEKPKDHKIITVPYMTSFHTVTAEDFDDIYAHPRKPGSMFFGGGVLRDTYFDKPGHAIRRAVVDGLIVQKKILMAHLHFDEDTTSNNYSAGRKMGFIEGGGEEAFVGQLLALPPVRLVSDYHNVDDDSIRAKMRSLYEAKLTYDFCLEMPGDTPTRRSIYESVILGCIPVFFDKATVDELAFTATIPWLKFSILEDMSNTFPELTTPEAQKAAAKDRDTMIRVLKFRQRLAAIPRTEIDNMRKEMRKWAPYMQFANDGTGAFELAFA